MTIAAIVYCSCVSIHAQDSTVQSESRYILIVNKTHETLKEINIGDEVRLKLTNEMKVKGHVTSIDSTFFTVDTKVVHLHEIEKISTKNKRSQIIVGGALLAGGIASFASYDPCFGCGGDEGMVLFLGVGLTVAAIKGASPSYHKIGTSNWFVVISNKPSD